MTYYYIFTYSTPLAFIDDEDSIPRRRTTIDEDYSQQKLFLADQIKLSLWIEDSAIPVFVRNSSILEEDFWQQQIPQNLQSSISLWSEDTVPAFVVPPPPPHQLIHEETWQHILH